MVQDHLNPSSYSPPRLHPGRHTTRNRLRTALRSWLAIEPTAAAVKSDDIEKIDQLPTSGSDADWPSVEVVYDEVQAIVAAQNDRFKTIDTKANFGLAAATLLTAGVTGLGRALAESGQPVGDTIRLTADIVTLASLALYALIAGLTYTAYRIQTFREVANPTRLVDVYLYKEPAYTKAALSKQRAKNFDDNEWKIDRKATWVNRAMVLLVVEAVLLVVIAFIQVVWL